MHFKSQCKQHYFRHDEADHFESMSSMIEKKDQQKKLRVALVHDYLREYGGAERVVEALHELFPDAPLFTAFVDQEALGIHWQQFAGWDIRQTNMVKLPFYKKLFSPYRIFAPQAFKAIDLSNYDVVISSSNAYFAKAVTTENDSAQAVHLCYCHTPARSLYGYTTMSNWKQNPVTRFFGTLLNHYLRVVDFKISQGPMQFLANSQETQRRITKFYRRDSQVIYPPVTIPSNPPVKKTGEYFLYVGRLAASKHVELAIKACTQLSVPLKVVGSGKGMFYLKELAGPTVSFEGAVDDDKLAELYRGAKALIFPAEDEDFGIVPVEAMGHGVPVIAHRSGGPKETILEGRTGLFFDALTTQAVVEALCSFETYTFDKKIIYQHAITFSKERFQKEIFKVVEKSRFMNLRSCRGAFDQ